MSRLLQLYEGYEGIFDEIIQRLRGDTGFKGLFQSCRALHSSQLFLSKLTALKLLLWKEEENGSVAAQLAKVPRGAHITKLVLWKDSFDKDSPFIAFQRGVLSHLNCWKPGMLELGSITTLELQGLNFRGALSGSFGGTLHAAFPLLQHLTVEDGSKELLAECAAASIQLKSLKVTLDNSILGSSPGLFETLGRLTSLEALTIFADCAHHHHHPMLAGLTNLTAFTWDIPKTGEHDTVHGNFGGVFPTWHKLTTLSLFHCARGLPPVPASLKCLHVQCLSSDSLFNLHLLPEGLMFRIDLLILDCLDLGAAHMALANLQSAHVNFTCDHLRLLCGGRLERGSLCNVLPLLARHKDVFVKAGTHKVSAMHVNVMLGEVQQLASLLNGISKLGMVDYSLASLSVVEEAVRLPGLSVLQLRCRDDDRCKRACEVQAACVAGEGRQQSLPLIIEFYVYPYPDQSDFDEYPEWVFKLFETWTAALPIRVALRDVPYRFGRPLAPGMQLDDVFF